MADCRLGAADVQDEPGTSCRSRFQTNSQRLLLKADRKDSGSTLKRFSLAKMGQFEHL